MQPRLLWNKVGAGVLALAGEVIAQGALPEGAPIGPSGGFAGWAGAL